MVAVDALPSGSVTVVFKPSAAQRCLTDVFGWRAAAAFEMNRPLIDDRFPAARDGTVWRIVFAGWRAAVDGLTNLPVIADR